jgi:periplasmic divalent cation tolerance protein
VFRWEGEVQTEQEWRVEIKTAAGRVSTLAEHTKAHHSYDVPEIIATPITDGSLSTCRGWWRRPAVRFSRT